MNQSDDAFYMRCKCPPSAIAHNDTCMFNRRSADLPTEEMTLFRMRRLVADFSKGERFHDVANAIVAQGLARDWQAASSLLESAIRERVRYCDSAQRVLDEAQSQLDMLRSKLR